MRVSQPGADAAKFAALCGAAHRRRGTTGINLSLCGLCARGVLNGRSPDRKFGSVGGDQHRCRDSSKAAWGGPSPAAAVRERRVASTCAPPPAVVPPPQRRGDGARAPCRPSAHRPSGRCVAIATRPTAIVSKEKSVSGKIGKPAPAQACRRAVASKRCPQM
jgi:hypothetical protein